MMGEKVYCVWWELLVMGERREGEKKGGNKEESENRKVREFDQLINGWVDR